MQNSQYEKSRITVEIIEYNPEHLMEKTVIKKHSGSVNTSSTKGSESEEKRSPYDSFLQVIDGAAKVRINNMDHPLSLSETLHVLPNHAYTIHSDQRFKMILTTVKPE